MRLVQNQVKHGAEASNPDLPQVHTRADVTEAYLTSNII
jgi:hypothetical protein